MSKYRDIRTTTTCAECGKEISLAEVGDAFCVRCRYDGQPKGIKGLSAFEVAERKGDAKKPFRTDELNDGQTDEPEELEENNVAEIKEAQIGKPVISSNYREGALTRFVDSLIADKCGLAKLGARVTIIAFALGCPSLGCKKQKELAERLGVSEQRISAAIKFYHARLADFKGEDAP